VKSRLVSTVAGLTLIAIEAVQPIAADILTSAQRLSYVGVSLYRPVFQQRGVLFRRPWLALCLARLGERIEASLEGFRYDNGYGVTSHVNPRIVVFPLNRRKIA
jgi:hypothetical protein